MYLLASWASYALPIVLIVALVVIAMAVVILRRKEAGPENSPYEVQPLLTPAERSFWLVLCQCLPAGHALFAKVRLADIVTVKKGFDAGIQQGHFNRITSKHADFVICDEHDLVPRIVLELDDSSHQRRSASKRDNQKDEILEGAGLQILRIRAQRTYNTGDLQQRLLAALASDSQTEAASPVARKASSEPVTSVQADETETLCPKCGSPMVRRVAKQGANKGQEFLGCGRYPHCKGVITLG